MQPSPFGTPGMKAHGPPAHLIVDHAHDGVPQLLTAIGPKLTTSRAVAEQLLDMVCLRLGRPTKPCETARRPLAAAPPEDVTMTVARALAGDRAGLPDDVVTHLVRSHGAGYDALIDVVRREPALAARVEDGSPVIAAQLHRAAQQEMAGSADDLINGRTELGATAHSTSRAHAAAESALAAAAARPIS
jgi:glycerol-3-phosphate dehydrogenase